MNTKEDSVQDIRDTIRMLQALVEARAGVSNASGAEGSGIMNMFGDPSPATVSNSLQQSPDPNAMVSLFGDDETLKDDVPKDTPKVEIIDY